MTYLGSVIIFGKHWTNSLWESFPALKFYFYVDAFFSLISHSQTSVNQKLPYLTVLTKFIDLESINHV